MEKQGPRKIHKRILLPYLLDSCSTSLLLSVLPLIICSLICHSSATTTTGLTCPQPDFSNLTYVPKTTKFLRVSAKSKFLFPQDVFQTFSKDAMQICRSIGLQSATIDNINEYWEVVRKVVDGNQKIAKLPPPKIDKIILQLNPNKFQRSN